MSNTYVKKYDVGQIKLDLPYANYIHELPLLSFGDVQHTINLSLVFNYARKHDGDCSFYIAEGFKLNLQKRIGFDACAGTPLEFIESNGKCISLSKDGDIYTFRDESQRILRKIGSTYEVEYPDFSKEVYNNHGYITVAYDKYGTEVLTYTYEDDRLTNISYRGSKDIVLGYNSSNQLVSITYAGCPINFNYNDDRSLNFIKHYSEVYYTFDFSNRYKVFIGDGVGSGFKTVTVTTNTTNKTITVSDQNADSMVYKFYDSINPARHNRMVEITNSLGVKTRLQYDNYGKRLYSYEANETDSDGNDTMFVNGRYTGNVSVYRNGNILNTSNYTTYMLNEEIEREWFANVSDHVNQGGCYILTGWIWSRDYDTSTIRIGGTDIQVNCIVGQWVYFATKFANQYETISIATGIVDENQNYYEVKDLRVTYIPNGVANTGVYDDVDKEEGFIVCNGTAVSLSSAPMYYKSGSSYISISGVTATDAIKYKLSKLKNINTTEVYYNKCKGVMKGVSGLFILHGGQYYDVKCLEIRKKITSGDKEYTTAITNDTSNIIVESFINDVSTGVQKLNMNLDVTETVSDGIKVTYEYESDSCGLISRQTTEPTEGADDTNTIVKQYHYNPELTKLDRSVDEFQKTTFYTTNDDWGVVTAITLPDGSIITDTYDGDMSVLKEKEFDDDKIRKNVFAYSNGRVTSITGGALSYTFGYNTDNGKLSSVIKGASTSIEEHEHTNTTINSYYPSKSSPIYSELCTYDKYGRLTKINGLVENTYDLNIESNIVINNDNLKIASTSKDLTNNQVSKYHCNNKGQLELILTEDSNGNPIQSEGYTYDNANRTTQRAFWNQSSNKIVVNKITYDKADSDLFADGKIKEYDCFVGDRSDIMETTPYKTANTFDDPYGRITRKAHTFEYMQFTKDIEYDKSRVKKVFDNVSGDIQYEYDSMGRIVKEKDGLGRVLKSYTYDTYGQLTKEVNNVLDKTFDYVYNGIGNIVSVTTTPTGGTATTESFTYDADKLTAYNGSSLTYDANGCLKTSQQSVTNIVNNYTWDRGKLSSMSYAITLLDRTTYNYTYDAYGRRTAKNQSVVSMSGGTPSNTTVNTSYDYDLSGRLIREKVVSCYVIGNFITTEKLYLYDESGVIGMIYTNNGTSTTYYFQRNIQGDVVAIYDTNGNKVTEYAYDAFGNCTILSTTNTIIANENPFRYRGYYLDAETGFYYLNARYYSPEWRRFISPDDTAYLDPENVNGLNLYCYCGNDPVNYADPSGHWLMTVLDLLSAGTSVVEVVINPADPLAWAGLAGDLLDLFPIVTGVGETIKGMRIVKKGIDVADSTLTTIKITKAVDFTEDAIDTIRDLDRVGDFTKSSTSAGIRIHRGYKVFSDGIKEYGKYPGIRLDFFDDIGNIVYELKPYNPNAIKAGVKQLGRYRLTIGERYTFILELY